MRMDARLGVKCLRATPIDSTTVMDKVEEVRKEFELDRFVFVGDRGMVTQGEFDEIRLLDHINSISALTHAQLKKLLERNVIQPELFDEKTTIEIIDPDDTELRYCLCKNPVTQHAEGETRKRLLSLTRAGLEKIADYKKRVTVEILGARVGKLLTKYKVGKFIKWSVEEDTEAHKSLNHKLHWEFDQEKIKKEEQIDGCYIIRTDVKDTRMSTESIVDAYKALGDVERAFRNLKTVQLEMRPVYHKTDQRIRAHVFLCTLAYYVQWHMQQRLQPLLRENRQGANRRWSFEGIVERLKQQCRHTIEMSGITYQQDGELEPEQQRIVDLLIPKT